MTLKLPGAILSVLCIVGSLAAVPLLSDLLQRDATTRAMPVQMDMATDDDITICTGNERAINCRDGANMAVTNVFWGRMSDKICPSDDADPVTDCSGARESLSLVRRTCEGKKECKLAAKHRLLQNNGTSHCPGVNKYLVVNYTCIPESQGVTLCDNVETTLHCGARWIMELADVFWGRRGNAKVCGPDDSYECDASDYASKVLKDKCNGKRSCHIKANPEELDSKTHSCGSVAKYLMVNYICRPPSNAVATEEKEDTDVTDPTSKELMGLVEKHIGTSKITKKFAKQQQPSNTLHLADSSLDTAIVQPKKQSLVVGKPIKKELTMSADDLDSLSSVYKNIKKDETPKNTASTAKNEESLLHESSVKEASSASTKDTVAKTSTPEESYELSEPNAVRSILDRAKEVLKTLDADALPGTEDAINKRGGIAKRKDDKNVDAKFVNDTARAVKQVAQLAQNLVKHAEEKKILKNKTENLLKKSTSESKPNDSKPQQQQQQQQQRQQVAQQSTATAKQTIVKKTVLPKLAPRQFGNTP